MCSDIVPGDSPLPPATNKPSKPVVIERRGGGGLKERERGRDRERGTGRGAVEQNNQPIQVDQQRGQPVKGIRERENVSP